MFMQLFSKCSPPQYSSSDISQTPHSLLHTRRHSVHRPSPYSTDAVRHTCVPWLSEWNRPSKSAHTRRCGWTWSCCVIHPNIQWYHHNCIEHSAQTQTEADSWSAPTLYCWLTVSVTTYHLWFNARPQDYSRISSSTHHTFMIDGQLRWDRV